MTAKQEVIFNLVCQGFSAKEIGQKIGISHRTVERTKDKLVLKYGCKNMPHLIYTVLSDKYSTVINMKELEKSEIF